MLLISLLLFSLAKAIDLNAPVFSGELKMFSFPPTYAYRRISNAQHFLFTDEPPFNGKEVILHFDRNYNRTEIEEAVDFCKCAEIVWPNAPECKDTFCPAIFVPHAVYVIKVIIKLA